MQRNALEHLCDLLDDIWKLYITQFYTSFNPTTLISTTLGTPINAMGHHFIDFAFLYRAVIVLCYI